MRTLKALLIGGLVTASFASFSAAFADDWTYIQCYNQVHPEGGYIYRFNSNEIDRFNTNRPEPIWESQCHENQFSCTVSPTQIYFGRSSRFSEYHIYISRRTGQYRWVGPESELIGSCEPTTDPMSAANVF